MVKTIESEIQLFGEGELFKLWHKSLEVDIKRKKTKHCLELTPQIA